MKTKNSPRRKPVNTKNREFYALPLEEQHKLERKERVTLEYIQAQKNGDSYGARKKAAQALGVKERRMHDIAIGYQKHRTDEATRHRPGAEFFIDQRGRPLGTTSSLSPAMNLAIILSLHERERVSRYSNGDQRSSPLPPGISISHDVYDYVKAMYPDIGSLSSVRRAVARLIAANPGYYTLLLEGENALRRDGMPKLPSDVTEVDQNWFWDACDLPLFVNHNGIICRVVLLDIADQFSDYRIYHRIFPMRDMDTETDVVKKVHFTIEDAARFIATAFYTMRRRPLWLYNDRDSRFRHLLKQGYLAQLTEPEETPIRMHMSKPGEPWGRNYKEGTYGALLQRFLRQYGNAYYTKRTRYRARKNLKLSELRTPEQIEDDFREFFKNLNDLPRNEEHDKRSRREVYLAGIPARDAPPIRRLFRLPFEKDEGWVLLGDEGFRFSKTSTRYIPKTDDRNQLPSMFRDWTNVVLSSNKMVHYYAVHLDIGWRVEIQLGDTWYEAIPHRECDLSQEDREWAKNEVIKGWSEEIDENRVRIKAAVLEQVADLPVCDITRVVDRYVRLEPQIETADAGERDISEERKGIGQQQTPREGSGTGGNENPPIDWSNL